MSSPTTRLHGVTVLVDDYDEAIAHFVGDLGFHLVEDTNLGGGKRWVRVAPDPEGGPALLLAVASTAEQRAAIGRAAGRLPAPPPTGAAAGNSTASGPPAVGDLLPVK